MEHSKLQTTENGILESSDIADVLFKDDRTQKKYGYMGSSAPGEQVTLTSEVKFT